MDFEDLIDEVQARGFDYLNDTRVGRYVNQSYQEVCAYASMPWPFLEDSASGNAPLTISDLRAVLAVMETTNKRPLFPIERRQIDLWDPTLEYVSLPCYWYLDGTAVKVWPLPPATVSLSVRYIKRPADLVANGDEPLVPEAYHDLIVDGAVIRCQKDNDNYAAAAAVREDWQRQIDLMVADLMNRNLDGPTTIVTSEYRDY